MTPEAWGVNLGAIAAGGYASWQSWKANRAAQAGKQAAQAGKKAAEEGKQVAEEGAQIASLAAARSLPTSNGFVPEIMRRLDRLQEGQDEQGRRLDRHIDDHASSDLRRSDRPRE